MRQAIWEAKEKEKNIQISLNASTESYLKSTNSSSNQKMPKDSNEPCNLGPKRDKAEFKWRRNQSLKQRNKIINEHQTNAEKQSKSWLNRQKPQTPKGGSTQNNT